MFVCRCFGQCGASGWVPKLYMEKDDTTQNLEDHDGIRPGALLVEEEEARLVLLAQAGQREKGPGAIANKELSRQALSRLVESHIGLVRYLAKVLPPNASIGYEDLESAGVEGLLRAIRTFRPADGTRLWHYATATIKRAILEEVQDFQGLPAALDDLQTLNEAVSGFAVTSEEIVPARQSELLHDDCADVEQKVVSRIDREELRRVLRELDEADRRYLIDRFGLCGSERVSQKALALKMGLSRKALRCREERILNLLRRSLLGL